VRHKAKPPEGVAVGSGCAVPVSPQESEVLRSLPQDKSVFLARPHEEFDQRVRTLTKPNPRSLIPVIAVGSIVWQLVRGRRDALVIGNCEA
jgi:hypothetical protein